MANDAASVIRDRTAIVGIGRTNYARNIGKTEKETCLEAVREALADAGLAGAEVDAIFKVEGDPNEESEVARALGSPNLRMWGCMGWGGGAACGPVVHAAVAVASGMATVAVAYRARNRGSGGRPWTKGGITGNRAFEVPYGMVSPVQQIALSARLYLERYGGTPEWFAKVGVLQRAHAVHNPDAVFRTPITTDDVLNSRMIADPLHLLDCCPESDGACAVVVTSAERARDLRQPVCLIGGVAMATGRKAGGRMVQVYENDPFRFPGVDAARDLFTMAGVGPSEIKTAMLYDMFSPVVLYQLESWGLAPPGEAGRFLAAGGADWETGEIQVNTNGGSLSEAYIHGFNNILEGVRQVRGTSTRQAKHAEQVLVAAAPVVPTSAVLLRRG